MATRRRGPTFIQRSRAVAPEQKALYHQTLGAGRARVTRAFFDVSAAELDAIARRLDQSLSRNLAKER